MIIYEDYSSNTCQYTTDKVASKITVSCMLVAMAIKGKSGLNQAAYVK